MEENSESLAFAGSFHELGPRYFKMKAVNHTQGSKEIVWSQVMSGDLGQSED